MAATPSHGPSAQPTVLELQDTLYFSANPTRRWLHRTRKELLAELLRGAANGPVGRALEVGPGSGVHLPLLAELADEVVVTDIEESFLARARTIAQDGRQILIVADDITRSRLDPASFDLILCSEVLEHIENWTAAIATMANLLRPNGVLVLSTPQPWSPIEILGRVAFKRGVIDLVRKAYREPVLETGHVSVVSSRRLTRELQSRNLRCESQHWSGVYIPLLAELGGEWTLRMEQRLESFMQKRFLRSFLWTQYVVARR